MITNIGNVRIFLEDPNWLEIFTNFVPNSNIPFLGIKTFTDDFLPFFETKYWCPWYFENSSLTKDPPANYSKVMWGITEANIGFICYFEDDMILIEQIFLNEGIYHSVNIIKNVLLKGFEIDNENTVVTGHSLLREKIKSESYESVRDVFHVELYDNPKKGKITFYAIVKETFDYQDKERFIIKISSNNVIVHHEESFVCEEECLGKKILDIISETEIKSLSRTEKESKEKYDPRVWYSGVARHCPRRPTAQNIEKNTIVHINPKIQMLFPKENPVLYTAPEGYFIGLKENKIKPSGDYKNKYGEPFPAFPCYYINQKYKINNLYSFYLESKTDDEFRKKVENVFNKKSTKKQLISSEQFGSIINYEPISSIIKNNRNYFRKVINSWSDLNLKKMDDFSRARQEFNYLGYKDETDSFERYIKTSHLPDIRFVFSAIEKINKARVVIFVKENNKTSLYKPFKKSEYKDFIFVITYVSKDKKIGYEIIIDMFNNFIINEKNILLIKE